MQTTVLPEVISAVLSGVLFALAAFVGAKLSELAPDTVGAETVKPKAFSLPASLLCAAATGVALQLKGLDWQGIGLACALTVFLSACARDEITRGKMRAAFLFIPLAAMLLAAIMLTNWGLLLGGLTGFAPFAVAAYVTKGKGFSWGDAALAGLGGMILGMQDALIAFTAACLVVVCVAKYRNQPKEAIGFAPYLIMATAIGLALSL